MKISSQTTTHNNNNKSSREKLHQQSTNKHRSSSPSGSTKIKQRVVVTRPQHETQLPTSSSLLLEPSSLQQYQPTTSITIIKPHGGSNPQNTTTTTPPTTDKMRKVGSSLLRLSTISTGPTTTTGTSTTINNSRSYYGPASPSPLFYRGNGLHNNHIEQSVNTTNNISHHHHHHHDELKSAIIDVHHQPAKIQQQQQSMINPFQSEKLDVQQLQLQQQQHPQLLQQQQQPALSLHDLQTTFNMSTTRHSRRVYRGNGNNGTTLHHKRSPFLPTLAVPMTSTALSQQTSLSLQQQPDKQQQLTHTVSQQQSPINPTTITQSAFAEDALTYSFHTSEYRVSNNNNKNNHHENINSQTNHQQQKQKTNINNGLLHTKPISLSSVPPERLRNTRVLVQTDLNAKFVLNPQTTFHSHVLQQHQQQDDDDGGDDDLVLTPDYILDPTSRDALYESLPTIQYLSECDAQIVVVASIVQDIAHIGDGNGSDVARSDISLRCVATELSKMLNREVIFISNQDLLDNGLLTQFFRNNLPGTHSNPIYGRKRNQIILLENLAQFKHEQPQQPKNIVLQEMFINRLVDAVSPQLFVMDSCQGATGRASHQFLPQVLRSKNVLSITGFSLAKELGVFNAFLNNNNNNNSDSPSSSSTTTSYPSTITNSSPPPQQQQHLHRNLVVNFSHLHQPAHKATCRTVIIGNSTHIHDKTGTGDACDCGSDDQTKMNLEKLQQKVQFIKKLVTTHHIDTVLITSGVFPDVAHGLFDGNSLINEFSNNNVDVQQPPTTTNTTIQNNHIIFEQNGIVYDSHNHGALQYKQAPAVETTIDSNLVIVPTEQPNNFNIPLRIRPIEDTPQQQHQQQQQSVLFEPTSSHQIVQNHHQLVSSQQQQQLSAPITTQLETTTTQQQQQPVPRKRLLDWSLTAAPRNNIISEESKQRTNSLNELSLELPKSDPTLAGTTLGLYIDHINTIIKEQRDGVKDHVVLYLDSIFHEDVEHEQEEFNDMNNKMLNYIPPSHNLNELQLNTDDNNNNNNNDDDDFNPDRTVPADDTLSALTLVTPAVSTSRSMFFDCDEHQQPISPEPLTPNQHNGSIIQHPGMTMRQQHNRFVSQSIFNNDDSTIINKQPSSSTFLDSIITNPNTVTVQNNPTTTTMASNMSSKSTTKTLLQSIATATSHGIKTIVCGKNLLSIAKNDLKLTPHNAFTHTTTNVDMFAQLLDGKLSFDNFVQQKPMNKY